MVWPETEDQVGVVTGLAWTCVGGDLLQIEALKLPGKGRMKTTGKLGDVMKESIEAAASFVRSISPEIGVKPPKFETMDIHVHVPEGATPKDGPSAGLAMVTSIVSVITGIPVRKDIAMTGEVTLRGNALPIGGLKEKLLAALRGGIKTVFIPKENDKDLIEIPGQRESRADDHSGHQCARSAEAGAGAPARAGGMGRGGGRSRRCGPRAGAGAGAPATAHYRRFKIGRGVVRFTAPRFIFRMRS